jgi:hypothetical protein
MSFLPEKGDVGSFGLGLLLTILWISTHSFDLLKPVKKTV